jgi:uncharacterized membrane protein
MRVVVSVLVMPPREGDKMSEHSVSVTIQAPVHQVYTLFTHFDDFPKFMSFVKEVTYYDEQRTHWVVHVLRDYEWNAVNEDWIVDRQVGWRSTSGLKTTGKVKFRAMGPQRTIVDVYVQYTPPTGSLGKLGDALGGYDYFDAILREDVSHFARMVEQAPAGALDPMSSHYLFHKESAFARGLLTRRQKLLMEQDPRMSAAALAQRQGRIEQEEAMRRAAQKERETAQRCKSEVERAAWVQQQVLLEQEAARRLAERKAREALLEEAAKPRAADPDYETLGGRGPALERTALGERDSRRQRYPQHEQDPMTSRLPAKSRETVKLELEDEKVESPWRVSIRGTRPPSS